MTNILFVCTGNTCRSPMAEALLKNKDIDDIYVKSAGVFATNGSEASLQTMDVLAEKNIKMDHKSTFLTTKELNWANYILTMTLSHKDAILNSFPQVVDKVFTLKEFVADGPIKSADVSDPYGAPVEIYRVTRDELEPLINALVEKIKN